MRQIATLPAEATASAFADYLLTLHIETRLEPDPGGWALWVCDEDRVAQARQELEAFTKDPANPRYRAASSAAERIRREETHREEAYRREQERLRRAVGGLPRPRFLTIALLAVCISVTIASGFGNPESSVVQWLAIASWKIEPANQFHPAQIRWYYLNEIREGQVWRLVTPIFIHMDPLHLFFNCSMLYWLGSAIEARRGWVRSLLLVLVLAVGSNLAEYYLGHSSFKDGILRLEGGPNFGGMSGVLYGLFGYAWMKARYEPDLGVTMSPRTVFILLAWFFLCWANVLGPIANMAHTSGLLIGLLIGRPPWRYFR